MSTLSPMYRDKVETASGQRAALLLAWVCTLISGEAALAAAGSNPHTWQRWEHALTSTRNYGNPYSDVTLRAIYTGPAGQTIRAFGFWDGGETFRIRCAFPTPDTWRWETECSDAAGQKIARGIVPLDADGNPDPVNGKIVIMPVSVSPTGASLGVNGTQQFSATGPAQSNVAAPLLDAKVVKFTFGTPSSVTRTGFVKVTVKDVFTPEKGYGFQSTEGLLEYDRGGSEIVLSKDEYTASVYGAYEKIHAYTRT